MKLVAGAALTGLIALGLAVGSVAVARADDGAAHFATGAVLDPPALYRSFPKTPSFRAYLPAAVDLSDRFPTPGDQGQQGSCTAWAVGYAARSYYADASEQRPLSDRHNIPSPAFIYDSLIGLAADCQGGVAIGSALNLLETNGALSLADYPYSDTSCAAPSAAQIESASDFKIAGFASVDMSNPDQIKGELAQGNPVILDLSYAEGLFPMKGSEIYGQSSGPSSALHAVTIVGYNEAKQAFKFINSWGTDWGDHGFGWLSYKLVAADALEAFVIQVDNPPPPPVPSPAPGPEPQPTPTPQPQPRPQPQPAPVNVTDVTAQLGVQCGRVLEEADGSLDGFVGTAAELGKAQDFADGAHLRFAVKLMPWPQCEAVLTLHDAIAAADGPRIAGGSELELKQGDDFSFAIDTPSHRSFLQVSYIEADGTVLNLSGSEAVSLADYPPRSHVVLGDGHANLKFTVAPPLGNEMLLVVASQSPLFPQPLPRTQTDREYLTALRAAILLHSAAAGAVPITASYVTVKTEESK